MSIKNIDRQYASATERVAQQAAVSSGEVALDSDTGNTYMRITSGWTQIGSAGRDLRIGEKSVEDMLVSMPVWKKARISVTGNVAGIVAGSIFGGIITQAVGTTTTLIAYDAASAVAADLIIPVTTTTNTNVAGAFTSPFGGAGGVATAAPSVDAGMLLTTGLHVVIGGTGAPTFWVLYR